jgi:hypothetical protein
MSKKIYEDTRERFKVYNQKHKEKRALDKKNYLSTLKGRLMDLVNKCSNRALKKQFECNIDFDFLLSLWNGQGGKCAVTNLDMSLMSGTPLKKNGFIVSVDRKDSSKGYTKDNVHLVCFAVNQIKSNFTDEEFEFWIRTISSQAFN